MRTNLSKGDKYQIYFKGMTPGGDLKRMALAVAKIQNIQPNDALEKIKGSFFVIHNQLNDTQADKLYKLLRSFGANVTLSKVHSSTPSLAPTEVPAPRRRIHALFMTVMIFIILLTAFLAMSRLIQNQQQTGKEPSTLQKVKTALLGPKILTAPDYIQKAIEVIESSKRSLQKENWKDYRKNTGPRSGNLSTREFSEAFQFLDRAENLNPTEERVDQWRAQLYDLDGQLIQAEQSYKKGLRKNPKNIYLRNDYANFLTEQEAFQKAEHQYLQALEIEPENPETHKNIGTLYQFYLKDSARAREHYFEFAKRASPRDLQRYLVMKELGALSYYTYYRHNLPAKGQTGLSFDAYESRRLEISRKLTEMPDDPRLHEAQGILYAQRGMHDIALRSLKKAKDLDRSRPSVYKERASIYMVLENIEQAYRELSEGEHHAEADAELIGQLALLEKYYRYDTAKVNTLTQEYLQKGGHQEALLRDLLDKEGMGRSPIRKSVAGE